MKFREVIERFEIVLEHDIDEQYQYEPGEVLRGRVELVLNMPIKVKAIQVHIKGEANVSWEDDSHKTPTQYNASETYIDVLQNLLFAGQDLIELDSGTHRYPMEYILPQSLPSSFIGKYGSITFVVKATLKEDKKFGLSTMITSEPFLVLRRLDISQQHKLQMAREEKLQKSFSGALAFCVRGKVSSTFRVNKTGHLPGEDIFMDAEITNNSPRVVNAVEAAIVMHSTFHARNKKMHNKQIVNKKRDEWELSESESRHWKGVRLTIPPYIPESRLDGCDIIDIRYELEFKVDIGKSQVSAHIPLTVGTSNGNSKKDESKPTGSRAEMTRHNWHSRENLDDGSTLGGIKSNGSASGALNTDYNSNVDADFEKSGLPISHSQVDMDEISDATLHFRRPLAQGQTRANPLLNFDQDDLDLFAAGSVSPPVSPITPTYNSTKGPAPLPPVANPSPTPEPPEPSVDYVQEDEQEETYQSTISPTTPDEEVEEEHPKSSRDDMRSHRRSEEYGRTDAPPPPPPTSPPPPPPPPPPLR